MKNLIKCWLSSKNSDKDNLRKSSNALRYISNTDLSVKNYNHIQVYWWAKRKSSLFKLKHSSTTCSSPKNHGITNRTNCCWLPSSDAGPINGLTLQNMFRAGWASNAGSDGTTIWVPPSIALIGLTRSSGCSFWGIRCLAVNGLNWHGSYPEGLTIA